jgi:hypothetical protein
MTKLKRRDPTSGQSATDVDHVTALTRRMVLAGVAATAALTIEVDTPAIAQTPDLNTPENMEAFLILSAALTGIAKAKLAPDTDPIDIKQEYFRQASDPKHAAAFAALLQMAKNANLQIPRTNTDGIIKQDDVDKLVAKIEANEDTRFLARSIVLMWYLGSWYEPSDLQALTTPNPRSFSHTVISPKAYTQGWLWRVVQAHPMGHSDMQFGYWTRSPAKLVDFIAVAPNPTKT